MWNHFYISFLSFMRSIKTRILNIKFKIRDVQNRVKIVKIRKRMWLFFYKSFLFYKLFLFFMHHFFFFLNIRIWKTRFKIRDVQSRIKRVKIENLKMIMSFWIYSSRCHIEKISLFNEKSFFDKFIFNLFNIH